MLEDGWGRELLIFLATAGIVAGCFDPPDEGLRRRVARLVDWLNDQPPLAAERKEEVELQLRKLLVTRLRLEADRRRIAAIAEERIERPIFVVGFARTGTTLLQSLLAQDPAARTPLWWHTHDPSPPPGERLIRGRSTWRSSRSSACAYVRGFRARRSVRGTSLRSTSSDRTAVAPGGPCGPAKPVGGVDPVDVSYVCIGIPLAPLNPVGLP